jgi:hypothetical protein
MGKNKRKTGGGTTSETSETLSWSTSTDESNQEMIDAMSSSQSEEGTSLLVRLGLNRDEDSNDVPSWSEDVDDDELGVEEPDVPFVKPSWTRKERHRGVSEENDTERRKVSKVRALREKRKGLSGLGLGRKEKRLRKKGMQGVELDPGEAAAVRSTGWPADPFAVDLDDRLVDGPGLTSVELAAIGALSFGEGGRRWLSCVGLFSMDRAYAYLRGGEFYEWLRLEPAARVQLATIAYADGIGRMPETPAYSLGRHYMLRTDDDVDRVEAEVDRDGQIKHMFRETLTSSPNTDQTEYAIRHGATPDSKSPGDVVEKNDRAIDILERIFLLLQAGLQVYDESIGEHVDLEGTDVCRALAHGGRINIRIPAITGDETGRELPEWLGLLDGGNTPVFGRMFGTHHLTIGKNDGDGKGKFVEDGGGLSNLRNFGDGASLFGMDLSGGGFGNLDHNGDLVLPDGAHGHMFFGFNPPKRDRDGGLQIGIETTRPGSPSLVGYHHGPESTELTANPESTFGGHKTDKIGDGKPRQLGKKSKEYDSWESTNGRYVDLSQVGGDGGWETYLERLRTLWYEPLKEEDPRKGLDSLLGPRNVPDPETMRRQQFHR